MFKKATIKNEVNELFGFRFPSIKWVPTSMLYFVIRDGDAIIVDIKK